METNERALLRSKEGEKSVSIDCLPIFLPLLQEFQDLAGESILLQLLTAS